MNRIEKVQAKIEYLKLKKENLSGKKRSWCRFQISRKKALLHYLLKLKGWGVLK